MSAFNALVENMSPKMPNMFFKGQPVETTSSEQMHGGKLERGHVHTRYKNNELKVWYMADDTLELAQNSNHIPRHISLEFLATCEARKEEIKQFLDEEALRLKDSTQVSLKGRGEQYDGKTIPDSENVSKKKQKRQQRYQQPDKEPTDENL